MPAGTKATSALSRVMFTVAPLQREPDTESLAQIAEDRIETYLQGF